MTTLPLPDPHQSTGRTREVLELAARRGGLPLENVSAIHRAMAHWPEWLEANLAQTAATFKGQGQLPPLTRECLHIAISASNNCRFWLGTHAAAGARLGLTARGFAEVVAVAEHVAGQSRAANALGLTSEASTSAPPLVALVDEQTADTAVRQVFDEIKGWAHRYLGWERVPLFWRAVARRPRYLAAAWAKTTLVLEPGEVEGLTKTTVAFACASLAGSRYFVEYYQAAFRHLGFDDETIVELAGLVNHYASFNTVAHAFQLESPGAAAFAERSEHADGSG